MERIIIDVCGGTGSWSEPYRRAGYKVVVLTLPYFDVCNTVFEKEQMVFRAPSEETLSGFAVRYDQVHGILAAPPCTEFSVAKGNKPRDFQEAMRCVEACLKIIWGCRKSGSLKFWALENPRGFLRQFLGIPPFTFEHWQYGDRQIKPTDIWGYFKKPTRSVLDKPKRLTKRFGSRSNGRGWAKPKLPAKYAHMKLSRAALRAITPPRFAEAFFKANP